jgi:hypothetical protein
MIRKPLAPITVAELASSISRAHAALQDTDPKMQQVLDALASLGAKPAAAATRDEPQAEKI